MDNQDDNTRTHIVLTKGTMVSHYRILEKIGAGGMGEVYLAEDTKLNRRVALKFLPAHMALDDDVRIRFTREAQAAAKLDHPNIVTIYEVGDFHTQPFFAMQYVEGKTLQHYCRDETLSIVEIIGLVSHISAGLSKAHTAGVTHRDIKAANIVVDNELRPKILDFGLATIQGNEMLTKAGSTLGTIAYMSPEQAQGFKVDHRSDLFSLGVVLYELITGRTPHGSDTDAGTVHKIINDAPEPLARYKSDVPQELQRIVSKCLAKKPDERYQSAADLTTDLRLVGNSLTSGIGSSAIQAPDVQPSIAVLPFANMSADPENEFFADGLTEELLNVLAKNPELKVTGRTSSFAFKGKQEDLREIGNKLGVKTILEGSVRKAGNRVRITVQLVKTSDGFHLWSETYDRILEDIFAVQDEIAQAVATALNVTLFGKSRLKPAVNPESYALVLRARKLIRQMTKSDVEQAVDLYQEAINLDSGNAHAWAGLAKAFISQAAYGMDDTLDALRKGKKAAQKALELDDTLAEAYVIIGWIRGAFEYHFDDAGIAYHRAYELAPNDSQVLGHLSYFKTFCGQFEEAVQLSKQAVDLDPLNPEAYMIHGRILSLAGRLSDARLTLRQALEMSPGMTSVNTLLSYTYLLQDRLDEALVAANKEETNGARFCSLTMVYHAMDKKQESDLALEALLAEGESWGYQLALVYAFRNERDKAFEWLDRAASLKDAGITLAKTSAFLTNLHSDPRWPVFLKRIGFTVEN